MGGYKKVLVQMMEREGANTKKVINKMPDYEVGEIFDDICTCLRNMESESLTRNGWKSLENLRKSVATLEGNEYER